MKVTNANVHAYFELATNNNTGESIALVVAEITF